MTATVSTDGLPPADRVELWRQAMSEAFVPLTVARLDRADEPGFTGTLRTHQIGELMLATLRSSPQRVDRTAKLIADSDRELLQIAVGGRGRVLLEQDGRQTVVGPGDLVVYETARPFHWTFDEPWDAALFTLPRAAVALTAAESRLVTARRLPGNSGAGALASRFLRDLAGNAASLPLPQLQQVVTDLTDLVLGLLSGPARQPRRALLHQVKAYLDTHYADPDLTPPTIAAAHHISTRYLHALFADEPTSVAGYLRRRRLRQCAHDLADPRHARRTVAAVAAGAGFGDLRGFERAFKAGYGMTPREYRDSAQDAARRARESAPSDED